MIAQKNYDRGNFFVRLGSKLYRRYTVRAGYRELFSIAFPLIVSTSACSIQLFIDRMFLTWYSPVAIAAVMPAGLVYFALFSFFLGVTSYANTFVAQYYGARQYTKIGPSIWQALYASLIGGIFLLLLIPLAGVLFSFADHAANVIRYEVLYFQIICVGGIPSLGCAAIAALYSGRGKPWFIMWMNLAATCLNLILDYILIFGKLGFPELGVAGAGIATLCACFMPFIVYLCMLAKSKYNNSYHTLRGWRFKRELFGRLLQYGIPNGISFFLEIVGVTVFVLLVGRLGTTELAASSITFNINNFSFMPMVGLGIAVSVMVGQYIGAGEIVLAEKSVYSALHVIFLYLGSIAFCFWVIPEVFLFPFEVRAEAHSFAVLKEIVIVLMRFLAVFAVFDGIGIVFSSAIRGAGDTKFAMLAMGMLALVGLIIPGYLVIEYFQISLYAGWLVLTIYLMVLAIVFWLRFRAGKWKTMKVIEESHPVLPTITSEVPLSDVEFPLAMPQEVISKTTE
jgi:multidrug resistance protein, MATE family